MSNHRNDIRMPSTPRPSAFGRTSRKVACSVASIVASVAVTSTAFAQDGAADEVLDNLEINVLGPGAQVDTYESYSNRMREADERLERDVSAALNALAAEATDLELVVHAEWVCNEDTSAAPWDELTPPDVSEAYNLTWCYRSTKTGWALVASNARRHYCLQSGADAQMTRVDGLDACSPPDDDS